MIFDSLDNASFYFDLGSNIKNALLFLKNSSNLLELPVGRLEIDGNNVFALVQEYETKPFKKDSWEAHKKYYDIQFIVSGEEVVKVSRIEEMTPITEYNKEGDYWLFRGTGNSIRVKENQFMILSPEDIHQPGISINKTSQKIKKIVLKVLI